MVVLVVVFLVLVCLSLVVECGECGCVIGGGDGGSGGCVCGRCFVGGGDDGGGAADINDNDIT